MLLQSLKKGNLSYHAQVLQKGQLMQAGKSGVRCGHGDGFNESVIEASASAS